MLDAPGKAYLRQGIALASGLMPMTPCPHRLKSAALFISGCTALSSDFSNLAVGDSGVNQQLLKSKEASSP